jgi:hypothetical protein
MKQEAEETEKKKILSKNNESEIEKIHQMIQKSKEDLAVNLKLMNDLNMEGVCETDNVESSEKYPSYRDILTGIGKRKEPEFEDRGSKPSVPPIIEFEKKELENSKKDETKSHSTKNQDEMSGTGNKTEINHHCYNVTSNEEKFEKKD